MSHILDRSSIEKFGDCPYGGTLSMMREILKAQAKSMQIEKWEQDLLDKYPELCEMLLPTIYNANNSEIMDIGTEVHKLIESAFKACDNNLEDVPEWICDHLPECRPDIQPKVIKAARYICDMLCNMNTNVLAVEKQLEYEVLPATASREAVIATTCLDLLCQGNNQSLHVFDWKGGFKRRTNSETVDSFQAQFIAWMLFSQECYKEVDTIHFWYYETRFGTKSYARFDRDAEHPRLPHLSTYIAIDRRVKSAIKLLLGGNMECWPTDTKCAWCGSVEFCKWSHIEAGSIADDPKAFIDKLLVDVASVTARKKAATAWIKAKGPIEGTACIYDKKAPTNRFTAEFRKKAAENLTPSGDEELDSHFS